ncbi:MAG: PKD domain-containing protein [Bacteroidales bacterium]
MNSKLSYQRFFIPLALLSAAGALTGCDKDEEPEVTPIATPYITKVLDFMPAVGQFTNELPKYEVGDTRETMNAKVLRSIGNNTKGVVSLGGFGGYVVVGFDHTIINVKGKRDFRVIGNAFYSASDADSEKPKGGSCEPGIIRVAYDANKNGIPDENEWYEIAGSAHSDPTKELWYEKAVAAGNDVKTHFNYEITYFRPAEEPSTEAEKLQYIRWEDNLGRSGYKSKNDFHNQCYFPLWAKEEKITFKGTCLPQNGIDESGTGNYYVLYKFGYGYADNEINGKEDTAIDIGWAINEKGEKVNLPGVDFIKIYTGVNQENGWLGECSTEISGVEDLHVLGIDIDTL